jgi:hypothetical protein
MNSSNNKTHYIIFCPLINSLYRSDILLVTYFLKARQTTYSFNVTINISHLQNERKVCLLMEETLHCKWYCTCSESQNKDFQFLKTAEKPIPRVTVLFHKVKQSRYRPGVAQRVPGS